MTLSLGHNQDLGKELRSCAGGLLRKAVELLADESHTIDHRIYETRKTCKRLRGLYRLCRSSLGWAYQRENETIRDAARLISGGRDSLVLVETCDRLIASFTSESDQKRAGVILARLEEEHLGQVTDGDDLASRVEQCHAILSEALARLDQVPYQNATPGSLCKGLGQIYRQGRRCQRHVVKGADGEQLHDWRKEVKYHRIHLELLAGLWRPVLDAKRLEAKALASALGLEHDLAVLQSRLAELDLESGAVSLVDKAAAKRRKELTREAAAIGARLFAASPRCVVKEFRSLFATASREVSS